MARPLEGILVVSIEQAVAAPMCTVRLADAGARVIKIERAEGETARHYDRTVHGVSAYFAWLNRGKESAVLDLKNADDIALAKRMVGRADVFVQNLAPGAAARLGLGSQDLVAAYPRLIAVDIVGYRQDSAYRDMRAYDMLVQAESGLCAVTGPPDTPSKVGLSVADICTGMNAHAAVLEALLERQRSGLGRAIEIAMFDGMADWMSVPILHYRYAGRQTPRVGLGHAAIVPYGPFACADGTIIVVVQNPGEWRRFCAGALERPDLIDDPRFRDNPARLENRGALAAVINAVFRAMPRSEVIARLEKHQLAWAKMSEVAEAAEHPALRSVTVPLQDGGSFECVAPPLHPELQPMPVPGLGAHSDQIRAEFAGGSA